MCPIPDGKEVVTLCGDKRTPTIASAAEIDALTGPRTLSVHDAYASLFGGPVGKSMGMLLVGIAIAETAAAKRAFVEQINDINGGVELVNELRGVLSALHSDMGKEGNSRHFDLANTDKPDEEVGCLYNGSGVKVLEKAARHRSTPHDPQAHRNRILVRQVMEADVYRAFGDDSLEGQREFNRLFDAFGFLLNELDTGKTHVFGRDDYRRQLEAGMPVAILDDKPIPVDGNADVRDTMFMGFELDRVGSAFRARELGLSAYRGDPGRVALDISALLGEHRIPARMFLIVQTMLATAVRAVLASKHGSDDPRDVPLGIVGNANETARAIDYASGLRRGLGRIVIA